MQEYEVDVGLEGRPARGQVLPQPSKGDDPRGKHVVLPAPLRDPRASFLEGVQDWYKSNPLGSERHGARGWAFLVLERGRVLALRRSQELRSDGAAVLLIIEARHQPSFLL